MKYKYIFRCVDRSDISFTTSTDIDFHKISNTAIAFNDIYINLANVIAISKEVVEEEKPKGFCDTCKHSADGYPDSERCHECMDFNHYEEGDAE